MKWPVIDLNDGTRMRRACRFRRNRNSQTQSSSSSPNGYEQVPSRNSDYLYTFTIHETLHLWLTNVLIYIFMSYTNIICTMSHVRSYNLKINFSLVLSLKIQIRNWHVQAESIGNMKKSKWTRTVDVLNREWSFTWINKYNCWICDKMQAIIKALPHWKMHLIMKLLAGAPSDRSANDQLHLSLSILTIRVSEGRLFSLIARRDGTFN